MVWTLNYGKRVYDWWGRHRLVYNGMMKFVTFGKERELRERVVNSSGVSEGDTVLDLACGSGANFELLHRKVGDEGTILGVDYSEGMLRSARGKVEKNGWSNVSLVRADAADTVIREESVDGAICTMSISAIPDHSSAVRSVREYLKQGARLAVMDSSDFEGMLRVLNPVIRPVFKYTTNWDYRKDVVGSLRELFGDDAVEVERYNSGSMYVAVATKSGEA